MECAASEEDNGPGGYPFIQGIGQTATPGAQPQVFGQVFSGSNVPSMFECYDDVQSPVVVGRTTLNQADCVAPDYVAVGEWQALASPATWLSGNAADPNNYVPDPDTPVAQLAWMSEWQQTAMASGAARTLVTYYGVGAARPAWTVSAGAGQVQDSVALAVEGPRSLQYDSTTTGQNDLTPNPFNITAYVYNLATDPGPYN